MLDTDHFSVPHLQLRQDDFFSVLAAQDQSSFVFMKNEFSQYLYANPLLLELAGVKSFKNVMNATDEMFCRDAKKAKIYREHDEEVLETEKLLSVCEYVVPKNNPLITKKMEGNIYPIYGKASKPIAVLGIVKAVSVPFKLSIEIAACLSVEEMNSYFKRYHAVTVHNRRVNLSKRELQCIIELIKGKTAAEIATALELKQTTVESYIDNLKNKLGATNKSSLVGTVFSQNIIQQIIL